MTQSPNTKPNNEATESNNNNSPNWKRRILLGTGCVLLLGVGGGLIGGWYFVQFQLSSLVETQVNQNVFAKRKLKIGRVTSFSPNKITFGESEIVEDEQYLTHATVESVRVAYNFDPLKLLLQRTFKLDLDIALINPDLHLEQIEEDGQYIWDLSVLQLKEVPPPEGFIIYEINLDEITVENIDLKLVGKTLQGQAKTPVIGTVDAAKVNSGDSQFLNNAKSIEFAAEGGELASGGTLRAEGNFFIPEEKIEVEIAAAAVQANTLNQILELPFELEAGKVGTDGFQIIATKGTLDALNGVGKIDNVTMKLPQLPQAFTKGNGAIEFRGDRIELQNVTGFFGSIPAKTSGSLTIPLDPNNPDTSNTGYNIKATTEPITIMQVLDAFELPKLPVSVSGKVQADLAVVGEIENPEVIVKAKNVGLIAVDRVKFNFLDADIDVKNGYLYLTQLNATPLVGGTVTGTGETKLEDKQEFQIQLQAKNIPGDAIALQYTSSLPIALGLIDANTNISGAFADNNAVVAANIEVAGGNVNVNNFQVRKDDWGGNIQVSNFQLSNQTGNFGTFNTAFNISGADYTFQPNSITVNTDYATVNLINGGRIIAKELEFDRGNWSANLEAENLQLPSINRFDPARGSLNLNGSLNSWDAETLNAIGNGELFLGSGKLNIDNLEITEGKFITTISTDRLNLDRLDLNTQLSGILRGELNGKITVNGDLNNLSPETVTANGNLNFTRGIAIIRNNLNAIFNWNGTRLEIEKATAKNFNTSGFVNLDLATANVENFYFDIAAVGLDLQPLPNLFPGRYSNLPVRGELDLNGILSGTIAAPQINAQLALRNFAICSLVLEENLRGNLTVSPQQTANLQLRGKSDRILVNLGPSYRPERLQIKLNNIEIAGQRQRETFIAEVRQFPINIIKDFAPFAGVNIPPALISQRITGELSGNFGLNLNNNAFYGENIDIQSPGVASNSGRRIPALSFDRIIASFEYDSGQFSLSNATVTKKQTKYILKNALVATTGDRNFQGNFTVENGRIQNLVALLPIVSSYGEMEARGTAADLYGDRPPTLPQPSPNPSRQILPAFCIPFSPDPCPDEIQEIPTNPPLFDLGRPKASIIDRLRRLAEIQVLLDRAKESQETAVLPPLEELRGNFNGTLTLAGSLSNRIYIDRSEFDFSGKNWQWGNKQNKKQIPISQLTLTGNIEDNLLTILPLEIEYQAGKIAAIGTIDFANPDTSLDNLSGQLTINNLSVAAIEKLINLPQTLELEGLLNATVNIGGNIDNPIAKGTLAVSEAKLNQTPVETLQGNFDYNNNRNARLEFSINSILAASAEPATISGSIPYKLPFASVTPDNQQLTITADIKDKALILLNILTRGQIAWQEGRGEVKLDIAANLDPKEFNLSQLVARGNIDLIDATISAPELIPQAPLKQINSKIVFDFDRIEVQNFQGSLGRGGTIQIAGNLPLKDPNLQTDRPLTVQLERLNLQFQKLYQGGVNGEVIITGSLFEPVIGGNITLSDGRVELNQPTTATAEPQTTNLPIEFDNLKINLDREVRIVLSPAVNNIVIDLVPLLNFVATGTLAINGNIAGILPEGTIELQRGSINLFTTQFRLARSYNNIARFSADRGLDPFLDVRLRTSVLETSRISVPSDVFNTNEIVDTPNFNFGTVETVRIQARVRGYASQLEDSLALTSSPPRSDAEIIALLGGNFVGSLAASGDATTGLLNLAGTAFFGTFQNDLAQIIGLSELRIFPTQVIGEEENDRRDRALDLAIEAAIDITDNASFSVQKILTGPEPARFGLRYRINRNLLLRGSTDFSGDDRFLVEYEIRF